MNSHGEVLEPSQAPRVTYPIIPNTLNDLQVYTKRHTLTRTHLANGHADSAEIKPRCSQSVRALGLAAGRPSVISGSLGPLPL